MMSQEKVNQYKEAKKNRKEIAKKERKKALAMKICAVVILLLIGAWLVYSAVVTVKNAEGPAVTVDPAPITEYINGIE